MLSSTKLHGHELDPPFMNASGVMSGSPVILKEWERSGVGAVVTKSITLDKKDHNPFDWTLDPPKLLLLRGKDWTINSMGLPNKGLAWWKDQLERVKFNVPVIASVATGTGDLNDYQKIVKALENLVDMFEINVSCPNTGKKVIGFDPDSMHALLGSLDTKKPLIVKLPPFVSEEFMVPYRLELDEVGQHYLEEPFVTEVPTRVDMVTLKKIRDVLEDHDIYTVTSHNTLGTRYPILGPPRGGLSGRPIHDFAVLQARSINKFSGFLTVGSGGVLERKDVDDFLGIKNVRGVQLGSGVFAHEDLPCLFVKKLLGES